MPLPKLNFKDPKVKFGAAGAAAVGGYALYKRHQANSAGTSASTSSGTTGGNPLGASQALGDTTAQDALVQPLQDEISNQEGQYSGLSQIVAGLQSTDTTQAGQIKTLQTQNQTQGQRLKTDESTIAKLRKAIAPKPPAAKKPPAKSTVSGKGTAGSKTPPAAKTKPPVESDPSKTVHATPPKPTPKPAPKPPAKKTPAPAPVKKAVGLPVKKKAPA